ncbi:hypothetical protein G6F62_015802 [Rhizopus arrhizus]|nr:hypothetical protein G6F62_015802 [Rhizopus arrhizus]
MAGCGRSRPGPTYDVSPWRGSTVPPWASSPRWRCCMRPTVAPAWRRRAGTWTKVWWKGCSSPAANLPSWSRGKSGRPHSFNISDARTHYLST